MKKLLVIWAALFAIYAPAASATNTPELTYPTGTRLATSSKIRAANIGNITFTGSTGTTTCTAATLTGSLTKNSGTEVEADISGGSFSGAGGDGRCVGPSQSWVNLAPTNGLPWCLRSTTEMAEDEFQIRGGSCSKETTPIHIGFKVPTVALECVYERSPALVGTFTTAPGDAVLTSKEAVFAKASGSVTCPTTLAVDSSFTLEKDEGGELPLYLSSGPVLTNEFSEQLEPGNKIKAHNVGGIKFTTGSSTWECTSAALTGTVATNSGTAVEATIESASFTGPETEGTCVYPFGNTEVTLSTATNGVPWCLRATSAMASDEFQIRGNKCSEAARPIRMVLETTTTTECLYERKAALSGAYTTHPEDAVLNFSNAIFLEAEPRKAACVDETTIDTSMTLERDEAGTHPMYIS